MNLGGATGADVVRLYHTIQHDVKEKFGIEIHPEVNTFQTKSLPQPLRKEGSAKQTKPPPNPPKGGGC